MLDLGFAKSPARMRVVVAMSGGVDSATVAALAAEAGYDVVGVTLQLYDAKGPASRVTEGGRTCCAGQDILDARRVADALDIPHYVLDYEAKFRAAVMDEFADAYLAGETPIPCVQCNRTVKFRDLLGFARDLGAEALLTGHYARRVEGAVGPELHRAAADARDQSYFLFATTREQLQFLRFPLGAMTKTETRALAARFNLPVAAKRDSQDICFVPSGNYARMLERLRPDAARPGEIVDLAGRVLGTHPGVIHFTVGQRRGLGLGAHTAEESLYVIRIDAARARVVVGPKAALARPRLTVRAVNWLADEAAADEGIAAEVKVRSAQAAMPATVRRLASDRAEVVFVEPESAIAPGQACVFYRGSRVLGGGWIEREKAAAEAAAA